MNNLPTAGRALAVQRAARPYNSGNNGARLKENLAAPRFCSQFWRLRPREWDSKRPSRLFSSSQNRGVVAANVMCNAAHPIG
jgi:hypothetical protein